MRRSVLLSLAIAGLSFTTANANATTVTVPDDIPTLEAAMDSSTSPYGSIDTIFVRPGVIVDTLTAYNIAGLTVIGLGDSVSRPEVKGMTINARSVLFINLRFSRAVRTIAKAYMTFRECRIDGELATFIDGDNRGLTLIDCYVTGRILADSDIGVTVHSCRFDGGSVTLSGDGHLQVTNSSFTGAGGSAIEAYGEVSLICRDNRIENCAVGVSVTVTGEVGPVEIRGNTIDHCGFGIAASGSGVAILDNVVTHSTTHGIVCGEPSNSGVEGNVVGWSGGSGIVVALGDYDYGYLTVKNNTSFGNAADGIRVDMNASDPDRALFVTNNIGYANHGFGLRSAGTYDPTLVSCNDWFANEAGSVSGLDPSPQDLAVDPGFCDVANGDVRLTADSPLLDAPGCGLIGARGQGGASTPTLLTFFTAERDAEGVLVRWQLADPAGMIQVWIERADVATGPWTMVSTEQASVGGVSAVLDRSALAERDYWYRLVAREGIAAVVISEPASVLASVASRFELTRVTPNPGVGPLRISFTLASTAAVELDLLDLQGRHVAALARGSLAAGEHNVEWRGQSTAPGIYFLRYRYPGGHQVQRVVRLR